MDVLDSLEVGKRYRIITARSEIYEGDFSRYVNGMPIFEFCVDKSQPGGIRLWGRREIGFRAEVGAVFEEAR